MKLRSLLRVLHLCALIVLPFATMAGAPLPMPDLKVPDGIGVSIHFRNPKNSEMQAMSAAGVKWLRVDLLWDLTETQAGLYDFSQYDALVLAASQYGMKVVFILCYNNPLYNNGYSPSTDASRLAYANWATAAVARYHGFGFIWELYNEPNLDFWAASTPLSVAQRAEAYSALINVAGPAIKASFPQERVVGPSVGYFDGWNANFPTTMSFIQTCLQQNMCAYLDGITVHPYRTVQPENVWSDYAGLRAMISNTAINTTGTYPPVLSGEWGYTSTWFGGDQATKAKYLSRSILHNYLCGIPLSIVYDWASGTNASNPEDNFGLVANYNRNVTNPVITPLPAYNAMKTINQKLGGYTYAGRIDTGDGTDFVLKFTKANRSRYVVWNLWGTAHTVVVPCAAKTQVAVTKYDGTGGGTFPSGSDGGFSVGLTDAPQFIIAAGQ